MDAIRGIRGKLWGLLVGLAITIAGWALLAFGVFGPLEDYGFDVHFRHLSTIDADPRIVVIDINDHALSTIGDWPWPRRNYAQLVRVLHELGAQAIALDLVLSDPAAPRNEHAGLGQHYDVDTELTVRGDPSADPVIFDDDELRAAIAAGGNVYLAAFFRTSPPRIDPQAVSERALELIERDPGLARERFDTVLRAAYPALGELPGDGSRYARARIMAALEDNFGLGALALHERLSEPSPVDLDIIERLLAEAKRSVARRAAARFFDSRPDGEWPAFFQRMLPETRFDTLTSDRADLLLAFRAQDAFRALSGRNPPVPPALTGRLPYAFDLTLPLDKFTKTARGLGFVSFEREGRGGVVRAVPMLVDAGGTLLAQLGLVVATDVLGIDRSGVQYEKGRLVLGDGPARRVLPIDADGLAPINWHRPDTPGHWQESFDHIPVTRLLEIAGNRSAVVQNRRQLGIATGALVELRYADAPAEFQEYVRLVNRRLALNERGAGPSETPMAADIQAQFTELEAKIQAIEADAVVWLRRAHTLWSSTEPMSDEERAHRDRINTLYADFVEGGISAHLRTLNDTLTARTDVLLAELGPRVNGKICLVGYTASGVADLVSSPVYDSMPGVMAHANILNTVLQSAPAFRASRRVNLTILLLAGIAVTWITATRGPLLSLLGLVLLVVATLTVAGIVFFTSTYYLASPVAAVQMCGVWAGVTLFRQATEERARRRFQLALAQYTSPAVAARIATRKSLSDLTPCPAKVTCFFSDLWGFTRMSERLGAERTREVLNPYLRGVSGVLVNQGAIVNKFMGDGIFAFFNAPIRSCESHAEAACVCALRSLEVMGALNRRPAAGPGLAEAVLAVRIGLSTGTAFVGDYGSDTKLDYTCIGDTVNLGSRLERANKVLGTVVLVDEATRAGAGDRFAFRSLGRIVVPGRASPADVHELIGFAGQVGDAARDYTKHFEQAVGHYQACEWGACVASLARCRQRRTDDPAIDLYEEAVARRREAAAPPDWNGALVLPLS